MGAVFKESAIGSELTPEQQQRLDIINESQASFVLEGYSPLTLKDGYPYELQQKWINGEINSREKERLLYEHLGLAKEK